MLVGQRDREITHPNYHSLIHCFARFSFSSSPATDRLTRVSKKGGKKYIHHPHPRLFLSLPLLVLFFFIVLPAIRFLQFFPSLFFFSGFVFRGLFRQGEKKKREENSMSSQGRNSSASNPMQRVKVYRLNDDGKWDDKGTGHVTIDYLERNEGVGLIVLNEEDNENLLVHRINGEDVYRRQEDTIIAWRDHENGTELALSFQEATGCSFIWEHICNVQRSIQLPRNDGIENGPHPSNHEAEHSGATHGNDEGFHGMGNDFRELPPVELSSLPQILKTIIEGCIMDHIRVAELIVEDQSFIPKILDLFKICEDLENTEGLHLMYKIMKGIILLNNSQIFERIFSDEHIMEVVGALEYDPDVHFHQDHRAFLKEQVVFKEAIPIKDPSLLSKIHQSYRVSYVKDVILPRVLDESTFASLNSIIHSNNGAIVTALKDDNIFMQELFSKLKSPHTPLDVRKNLILFLQEFCTLSKSLLLANQVRLFRDLVEKGLFDIVTTALLSGEKVLRVTGTDILILVLNQEPSLLRSFLIQQPGNILLGLLVKGMSTDFGEDMHSQYLEIIRMLLDPYTMAAAQRDSIVEIFYEKYMDQLVDVIAYSCPPAENGESRKAFPHITGFQNGKGKPISPDLLSSIMDLLCFCVQQHNFRIRYYFLRYNVIEKVLCLTRRKEKYLVVAAIRFLRTIIGRNDESLNRHIVHHNLFSPVIQAFIMNGTRYNLLNSAVLELVDYIKKENLKILVEYLVKKFYDQVEHLDCVGTFRTLKLKYEQNLEVSTTKASTVLIGPSASQINNIIDNRKRLDERALEKEEEEYFNEDSDDEEDTATARNSRVSHDQGHVAIMNGTSSFPTLRSGSIALVDYEDDDDPPVPESSSQEQSEIVKESILGTSSARDHSVEYEGVSPKRKLVEESAFDEPQDSKKQRLSDKMDDLKEISETVNDEKLNLKDTTSSHLLDDKNDMKSQMEENDEDKASSSDAKSPSLPNIDSNGHEVSKCRGEISPDSGDESVTVKTRNSLKSKNNEAKLGSASADIVRSAPQSPETIVG